MSAKFTALFLCTALISCTHKTPEPAPRKKPDPALPRLVGRIASIPSGRDFVLIQAYGKWSVPTGSILTSRGPQNRAANLRATGEQLGQYAAADIQSGTLEVGDGVHTIPDYSATAPPASPATPTSSPQPTSSAP